MQLSKVLLLHQWKIVPIAFLLIVWTVYGLQRQFHERSSATPTLIDISQDADARIDTSVYTPRPDDDADTRTAKPVFVHPISNNTVITTTTTTLTHKHKHKPKEPRSKTLIIYTYSESAAGYENLKYFLKRGLHTGADFLFVINGNLTEDMDVTHDIPLDYPNIKIIRRENTCYDLGTAGAVLRENDLYKKYQRFITLNASIRGPFLPAYDKGSCWSDMFLDRLDDKVKLVGTSFNCAPWPHLQSMLLATDSTGLSILLNDSLAHTVQRSDHFGKDNDPTGFSPCYPTMLSAIHAEMGLTPLIESQGYSVDGLLAAYQPHDSPDKYCKSNGYPDDILYNGHYFGSNVHPYELVFIKANRNIDTRLLGVMSVWHLDGLEGAKVWDTCGEMDGEL